MGDRKPTEAPAPQVIEELCVALPRPEGVLMWVAHDADGGPARQEFQLTASDAINLGIRLIAAAERQMRAAISGKNI